MVFSRIFNSIYFKGQRVKTNIMFMLLVQKIEEFPRPYSLRIFTYESSYFTIDIHQIIYN